MGNSDKITIDHPVTNIFSVLEKLGYKVIKENNESDQFDPKRLVFKPVNELRNVPKTSSTTIVGNSSAANSNLYSNAAASDQPSTSKSSFQENTINTYNTVPSTSNVPCVNTNSFNRPLISNIFNNNNFNATDISSSQAGGISNFIASSSNAKCNRAKQINSIPNNNVNTKKNLDDELKMYEDQLDDGFLMDDLIAEGDLKTDEEELFNNDLIKNSNVQTSSEIKTQINKTIDNSSSINNNNSSDIIIQTIENITLKSDYTNNSTTAAAAKNMMKINSVDCQIVEDSLSLQKKTDKYNFDTTTISEKSIKLFDNKKQLINDCDDECLILSDDDEIQEISVGKENRLNNANFNNNNQQQQQQPSDLLLARPAYFNQKESNINNTNSSTIRIEKESNNNDLVSAQLMDVDFIEDLLLDGQEEISFNVSKLDQSYNPLAQFTGKIKNDGLDFQLKRKNYPFSSKLIEEFDNTFGLREFRNNQLETMNAILLNNDCFVLMPTGGGKSVCYQLPAIVSNGITIVVSPLKSLIQDQIQKLNVRNVPADTLTQDISIRAEREIYEDLNSEMPTLKLLYLTPEKLSSNQKLRNMLSNLYDRQLLDRLVIDEAHCVSQWGNTYF